MFVDGAARLSVAFSVPPVVIGAVIIGFGTSAPEMVVSGIASGQGKLDIAAGNIIGSNVANLTLVLGISAVICVMGVNSSVLRREIPLSTASVVLFAVFIQDGLARWEGVVLAVAMVGALILILRGSMGGDAEMIEEVTEYIEEDTPDLSTGREALLTLSGLIGVIAGAQLAVSGASTIAEELGVGEGFIGLTLIALGTSLPELVTAIAAARKGEDQLIIGNLLGSNLFNSLGVGAVAALIGPGPLEDAALSGRATAIMVAVAVAAGYFMITGRRVTRPEAAVLLAAYAITVPLVA